MLGAYVGLCELIFGLLEALLAPSWLQLGYLGALLGYVNLLWGLCLRIFGDFGATTVPSWLQLGHLDAILALSRLGHVKLLFGTSRLILGAAGWFLEPCRASVKPIFSLGQFSPR